MRRLILVLRKLALWGGVALGLLLLSWFGCCWFYERQFEAAVETLRARGVRVDLDDFNRPPVPDDRNAALVLRAAMKWCEERELDYCSEAENLDNLDALVQEFPDEENERDRDKEWQAIEKWVDDLAPWFAQVDRAVRLPECDFGVDYRLGDEASMEPWPMSSRMAVILEWAVRVGERRGGASIDAVRHCETLLLWGRKIDPVFLISFLVAMTVDDRACDLLQRVARHPELDITRTRKLLDPLLVAAEDDRERLSKALESEFAQLADTVRGFATWEGARELSWSYEPPLFDEPVLSYGRMAKLVMLRPLLWRTWARECAAWDEGREILERDDRRSHADLKQLVASRRSEHQRFGAGVTSFHGTFPGVQKVRLRHRARLRVARLGLAALEYRHEHGKWPTGPADLATLFPDGIPFDPFTCEAFEFVSDGDNLRIEASVPWLDDHESEFREVERVYWTLPGLK